MKNTLLLLLCCPVLLQAQTPPGACNYAGTASPTLFSGQSHFPGPDTIYLCFGDSILIQHQGNAVLTGDPQPATDAGIAYGFYICPPTVTGSNLQAIVAPSGDPCVLSYPPAPTGLYLTQAVPNGGATWFYNSGVLQSTFGNGIPLLLHFAPITVDNWANTGYEATIGAAPGPCVNVNTADQFAVVYLNDLEISAVDNQFGNDCLGKFRVLGGYPEFDGEATYGVEVALTSAPSVQALVHNPAPEIFHGSSVQFSVMQPGTYTISVDDPIGCNRQFQIDMSGCNASDNLIFSLDTVTASPGATVCVPVRVRNFDIAAGSLSFNWDPNVLRYHSVTHLNGAISGFFNPATFLNTTATDLGQLGMVLLNTVVFGQPITIADDDILLELCFDVVGTPSGCTPLRIAANPAQIAFEDPFGAPLALTALPGQVCFAPPSATKEPSILLEKLKPNPVPSGTPAEMTIWSGAATAARLQVRNTCGQLLESASVSLLPGKNQRSIATHTWPPGLYFIDLFGANGAHLSHGKLLVY